MCGFGLRGVVNCRGLGFRAWDSSFSVSGLEVLGWFLASESQCFNTYIHTYIHTDRYRYIYIYTHMFGVHVYASSLFRQTKGI